MVTRMDITLGNMKVYQKLLGIVSMITRINIYAVPECDS